MSTPIRPLKSPLQAGLPDRLHNALLWRAEQAKVSLDDVAKSVGMSPEILAAKCSGASDILFQDVEVLEDYFTAIGFPGLIDEVRRPHGWASYPLPISVARENQIASRLLNLAGDIRGAGLSLPEFLGECGLLPYVHIMVKTDDAIRTVHCGGSAAASAVSVDRSILGRDLRLLNDRAYGYFLHNHISELLRRGQPDLCRITSPTLHYSRLSVPAGLTMVSYSFDVEAAASFTLR
ncbi:hypothetical protein [Ferrovibrio sp.]|uniref:hypothetical protein n=1 Tax=Ferrovibrio sp. TaxID=1917215 RepID=UPI0025BE366C|nr:hypothetical protein [Ferrovibrio sp.]